MKKRIAIFGGSLFQDLRIEEERYIPTGMQTVIELAKEYDIDNYSMMGMSITRAKRLIEALPMQELYSDCILALGEADFDQPKLFQEILEELIDTLQHKHIRPLLVSLPKKLSKERKALEIQESIDQLAVKKNVDYIYEGKTTKQVSYVVLENRDITKAILNLC
ncbi:MAG: hypothetical protein K2N64_04885 [Anaeroplasmataceae bacterium]|nr:hypothetical protein [Anaeroplasmataceae bacterium]